MSAESGDARLGFYSSFGISPAATYCPPSPSSEKKKKSDSSKGRECGTRASKSELEGIAPVEAAVYTPYGLGTVKNINPESGTPFEVEMDWKAKAHLSKDDVKWKKKLFQMSDDEKIQTCEEQKEKGKLKYKAGTYVDAIREYELGLIYLRQVKDVNMRADLVQNMLIPMTQNIAMARIQLGQYSDAIKSAGDSLNMSPCPDKFRVKGMYISAKANRLKGDYNAAIKHIQAGLKIDPKNAGLRNEAQMIQNERKVSTMAQKKMFSGVFKAEDEEVTTNPEHKRPASFQITPDGTNSLKKKRTEEVVEEVPPPKENKPEMQSNSEDVMLIGAVAAVFAACAITAFVLLRKK
mmetsp:Transcript_29051/g.46832  ORF Transcript_29051/g.46832 Transcript_29051/m.46832 type:complete len:350 (+) Transcript_29051:141-1190(+)|eukprot:CAMPEP_0203764322 /NCGR_PEP_ID=MMETSP0098-20131031/17605_1 /ASSEMBLY_ACC=CAM_ASM_000208 /TAXON_ID=96639 /ORGANISM=" , Strain NY0313808BC1" /LENGTH=349 /DNA_ID=CAMNT_0050660129 /DNA_START=93 /DNA_END=1142 /DNA_ORIENTATION=-